MLSSATHENEVVGADDVSAEHWVPPDHEVSVQVSPHQRTPDMAVQDFNGNFINVKGKAVKTRTCTRPLLNFIIVALVAAGALFGCLIALLVGGFEQPGAAWLQTMVAFCLGVFVPNPSIKKEETNV